MVLDSFVSNGFSSFDTSVLDDKKCICSSTSSFTLDLITGKHYS